MRVTGSGMGCPDWPKCFGLWAPPTCDCQLPDNYQELFLEKRLKKVERFTKALEAFGMHESAKKLRENKAILIPEEFNAVKAWIEYINRIFGVLAGLFALAFVAIAWLGAFSSRVKWLASLGLIMLVLNAWLGSIVVATNLLPGIVSFHFMLSFLSIFFFMLALHNTQSFSRVSPKGANSVWILLFILVLTEVLLGTFARETVERKIADQSLSVDGMLDFKGMGVDFMVHRFLPAAILLISTYAAWKYKGDDGHSSRDFAILAAFALAQICFGAMNIVFTLPPVSQVTHIVLGSAMPILCFYALLKTKFKHTL